MPVSKNDLVFLSYAHKDLEQVRKIYEGLKNRQLNIWFDKENLAPGKWKRQIEKAISQSKYFIICLSHASIERLSGDNPGFQDKELQIAWEFAREQDEKVFTIIPLRLDNCDRGDMRLSGWQQFDLFEDWEGVLDKLAVNLGGCALSDSIEKDERTENEIVIDNLNGKAFTFFCLEEYEKALSLIEAIINLKPDDYESWINKGVILAELGRHKEAMKSYDQALEIKPDCHESCYNKGNSLAELGHHEGAIDAYNQVLEIKPDYHLAWLNKGNSLLALGRSEEAIKSYDEAIKINPNDHRTWNNKGFALAALVRYKGAINAYNKALEIKPDFYNAWHNKGNSLADLGLYEEAIDAYKQALDIKVEENDTWYNLACVYSLKKEKDKAFNCLHKAIEYGFNSLSFIDKDKDLDFIRNEKEFQEILEDVKNRKEK